MSRWRMTLPIAVVVAGMGVASAGAAEYSATYKSGPATEMVVDTVVTVAVQVQNSGTATWTTVGPRVVRLGYHWSKPGSKTWLAESEAPTLFHPMPGEVAPGEAGVFSASVHAPKTPGSYVLHWDVNVTPTPGWLSSTGVATGDQPVKVLPIILLTALPPAPPKIDEIFPLSSITPGGVVAVRGSGFGDKFGEFYLKFATSGIIFRIWNSPGLWKDHVVSGLMDPDSSGLQDEDATLYVKTAAGAVSNGVPVKFRARRDVKLLANGDGVTTCSSAATENGCGCSFTFCGSHLESYPSEHTSVDSFAFSLKNGWVVDSYKMAQGGNNGWVKLSGVVEGADSGTIRATWHVDGVVPLVDYSSAHYYLEVYITGPAGIPYK
jgi:hypothetical protein